MSDKHIKLLCIGNSFTGSALAHLPSMIAASPQNHTLILGAAIIGGGPWDQHWGEVEANKANPAHGKPYDGKSLIEMLHQETWDMITIQQNSWKSCDMSTYYPYAQLMYDFIRSHAPQAEIIIHQTWAYRDDENILPEGYSCEHMYQDLTTNYHAIAKELGIRRIIPAGDAFRNAYDHPHWQCTAPDPHFDYKNPIFPQLPDQTHSLSRGWGWDEQKTLCMDHHANLLGEFLAGAVWFEFFFEESIIGNSYRFEGMQDTDAQLLQEVAHATVHHGHKPALYPKHLN